jgi:hypothetical protein
MVELFYKSVLDSSASLKPYLQDYLTQIIKQRFQMGQYPGFQIKITVLLHGYQFERL